MSVQTLPSRGNTSGSGTSVRDQVSAAEWQLRCELAAAHRLVAHFVFVDMTYNHISARVPNEPNHFLVKPETAYMEQVTASNLVKCDVDGKQVLASEYKANPAAYNVRGSMRRARQARWPRRRLRFEQPRLDRRHGARGKALP